MEAFLCEQNGKSSYHKRISIIVYGVTHTSTCTQQTTQLRCLLYTVIASFPYSYCFYYCTQTSACEGILYQPIVLTKCTCIHISNALVCPFFSFTFPRHQPTLPKDFLSFFSYTQPFPEMCTHT